MFFNWFKKKEIKNIELSLKIYDEEKGEEIFISKTEWINNFFKKKYENYKNNNEYVYNLILVALNYGIYEEILEYALKFNENDENSNRSIEILQEIYMKSNAYSEVINIYDKNFNLNCDSPNIYLNVLKAFKKLNYLEEYENTLYEAIYKFPNNKKLISCLEEIFLKKPILVKENMMETFSDIENSFLICSFFAKYCFENDEYKMANKYVLKGLEKSNYRKDFLVEISDILFKYNQYIEFENHILTKFEIEDKNINFTMVVLRYYNFMQNYKKGLELLEKMYSLNIYDDKNIKEIVEIEEALLKQKLKNEKLSIYEKIENKINFGDINYFNIQHPLFYYILDRNKNLEILKENNKNMLILPIYVDKEIKLEEQEDKLLTILPINILENLYKNTEIKMQISLIKDNIQILKQSIKYEKEYFKQVASLNKNLKYILTGNLLKENELDFKIEFYLYDCEKENLEIIYQENTISKNLSNLILEKLVEKLNLFVILIDKIKISKINEKYKLLNMFFDFDGNNYLRKFNFLYLLKESIKYCEKRRYFRYFINIKVYEII